MPKPRPTVTPIGIRLGAVAKQVERAFDQALTDAGGSRPRWLVLMALKNDPVANQRQLAETIGIEGATLTHHLNGMEADGLLTRRRDPTNRRVHVVELTDAGEAAFLRMVEVVQAFDERLRDGFTDAELAKLSRSLERLQGNVVPD